MAKFAIEWGIPEMAELWERLTARAEAQALDGDELRLFKKLVKAATLLSENPGYRGLVSHEISDLTKRYGVKVWQSYLENNTPGAGRIFWIYGPVRGCITIIGIEAHPESGKSKGYQKVKLSHPKRIEVSERPSGKKPPPGK